MLHIAHILPKMTDSRWLFLRMCGMTFQAAPVLYNKSFSTRLSTIGNDPALVEYAPASSYDWRHEAVDLSAYASMPNVLIAFKATSAVGNNLYIDNVSVIDQNAGLYTTTAITAATQVATGPFNSKVKFNTIGNLSGGVVKFQGSLIIIGQCILSECIGNVR